MSTLPRAWRKLNQLPDGIMWRARKWAAAAHGPASTPPTSSKGPRVATGTSGDDRDDDSTDSVNDSADASDDRDVTSTDAVSESDTDDHAASADDADSADDSEAGEEPESGAAVTSAKSASSAPASGKAAAGTKSAKAAKSAKSAKPAREGIFTRMARFFREVRDELKKVVTPSRKELVRYTGVVLGFLVVMMLIVALFDMVFGFGSSWVFGNGTDLFPQNPAATSSIDPAATDPGLVPTPDTGDVPAATETTTP